MISINIKTWFTSSVRMIRFCLLMGDKDALWVSPDTSFRVDNFNHFFVKRANSAVSVDSKVDLPTGVQKGDRAFIYGFTGFDTEAVINTRIQVTEMTFENSGAKANFKLYTWWDSKTY